MRSADDRDAVFLGSPSDVDDERAAVESVIDEINNNMANSFGYHLELITWKQTLIGYGRPQGRINENLNECDLFIGLMWKRWGSPPDNASSKFSSGFEEELETSLDNMRRFGKPEIFVLFKDIASITLDEIHIGIEKVQDYKQRLFSSQELLCSTFVDASDLTKQLRFFLSKYLIGYIKVSEKFEATGQKLLPPKEPDEASKDSDTSSYSKDTKAFLDKLTRDYVSEDFIDTVEPLDVARLRLFAASLKKPGNDDFPIGIHDANIIYLQGQRFNFGRQELNCLVDTGIHYFSHQNTPLWTWYRTVESESPDYLQFTSLAGPNDQDRIGAVKAMIILEYDFKKGSLDPNLYVRGLLDIELSSNARDVALDYFSRYAGKNNIAEILGALKRVNATESKEAVNAILSIKLRERSKRAAGLYVLETLSSSFDPNLIDLVNFDRKFLSLSRLVPGLSHPSVPVRLAVLTSLAASNSLTETQALALASDENAEVRYKALQWLEEKGRSYTETEARGMLVRPKPTNSLMTLFAALNRDEEGEKVFRRYRTKRLAALPADELNALVDNESAYEWMAYIVRADLYFSRYGDALRQDIDTNFEPFFETKVKKLELVDTLTRDGKLAAGARSFSESLRGEMYGEAIKVLSKHGNASDIGRIKTYIAARVGGLNEENLLFLKKYGSQSDIDLILSAEAVGRQGLTGFALAYFGERDLSQLRAEVIHKLAGDRINEVILYEMTPSIRANLLKLVSPQTVAGFSEEVFQSLFSDKSAEVRRTSALKAVLSLTRPTLSKLAQKYNRESSYRYYNVVHWLDLSLAYSARRSRSIAENALRLDSLFQ